MPTITRTATAARAQRFNCSASVRLRRTPRHNWEGVFGQSLATVRAVSRSSRSGMLRLLDPGLQPRKGPRQSRLHSALRDAQGGGCFLTAQLEEVPARDDKAVLVAQRVDHGEQGPPLVGREGDRLGGWYRIPRAEALSQPKLELVAPSRRAHPIASLVGDDPQKPWPEVGA